MMNKLQKLVSLFMCLCMLLGTAALAEEVTELAPETVVVTLNGESITWADLEMGYNNLLTQYGSYYDMTLQENIDLFRAVAMENYVVEKLLSQKAAEMGLDQLSEEEIAIETEAATADWDMAIADYISYFYPDLTEESSEEDKKAANDEALAYYQEMGYTLEVLIEDYLYYAVMNKVQTAMVQDAVVTDEEIEAAYQALVAADKELYENDIAAYVEYNSYVEQMEMYAALYGSASDLEHAWYKPEGFRAVKHILLEVDETLMTTYTDLQARLEEQASATEETAEEEEEPVTEAMVNDAKAAILASLADTIDEINTKLAEGADFNDLITAYGTDPGMNSEPYLTSGYEVSAASSNYVPEFVEASMSIEEVGGVSAPYLSQYGIHIVKYLADVPGGPVEMTDEERETKRQTLLSEKQAELYSAAVDQWLTESNVEYTGVVPTIQELEAAQTADGE